MTRFLLVRSRRAFSQQALRRRDDFVRTSTSSRPPPKTASPRANDATAANVQHALDGRSYLLPTMTLQRVPGSSAIATAAPTDGPLLQTRAKKTPIVLDLQLVSSDGSPHAQPIKKHELRAEIERLHELGFVPVGITNASEDVKQLASKMHLPYLISTRLQFASTAPSGPELEPIERAEFTAPAELERTTASSPDISIDTDAAVDVDRDATPAAQPPMVLYSSVRSGQQVFAQSRSLVVMGNVNSGAEVLADGDIYVLGALKGRALAGIGGDLHARIVCQSFDAELISIAHHFTTCDDLAAQPQNGDLRPFKPTTVCLRDDQLHFQSTT